MLGERKNLSIIGGFVDSFEKGGYPIGTVRNGYIKISEEAKGSWRKVSEEEKHKIHKLTKDEEILATNFKLVFEGLSEKYQGSLPLKIWNGFRDKFKEAPLSVLHYIKDNIKGLSFLANTEIESRKPTITTDYENSLNDKKEQNSNLDLSKIKELEFKHNGKTVKSGTDLPDDVIDDFLDEDLAIADFKDCLKVAGITQDMLTEDTIVSIFSTKNDNETKVTISIDNDKVEMIRHIYAIGGIIDNQYFGLKEKGTGKGTQIFENQVQEASKKGFKRLETVASSERGKNGYYTWARLGYIPTLEQDILKQFKESLLNTFIKDNLVSIPEKSSRFKIKGSNFTYSKKEAKIVLERVFLRENRNMNSFAELLSTERGRFLWKEYGFGFNAKFDLTPGSYSMNLLKNYIEEKKNKIEKGLFPEVIKGLKMVLDKNESNEIFESELDEEALDKAAEITWEKMK